MEDFNLPSPQRTALLKSLQEAIGDVPPYFWAMCQVCDLDALEILVGAARSFPQLVRSVSLHSYTLVVHWTQSLQGTSRNTTPNVTPQKPSLASSPAGSPPAKRQKTTDSPVSSPLLHRSQTARTLARERDGGCCVLTGEADPEVAHIYPFCRLKGSEENVSGARHVFWDHLKNFWSEEKVAAWEAELFPRGLSETGYERVDNLITLSVQAHRWWNRGAFALKPISICDNNTTLKVQFFWQKKQNDIQPTMSLLTIPLSTEGLDRNAAAFDAGEAKLVDREFKRIESGQIVELKTDDPIKKPLPSLKLLELQWFLTRVIGMAGAAFPTEFFSGDDWDDDLAGLDVRGDTSSIPGMAGTTFLSDGDVPALDLSEVGDISLISDRSPTKSPELLRTVNRLLIENLKHQTEEAEGDGEGVEAEEVF